MTAIFQHHDDTAAHAEHLFNEGKAPTRFGCDVAASRKMASRLKWMVHGDAEPDAARWQQLGMSLSVGDPLADALVAWMHGQGLGKAWPLVERVLGASGHAAQQDMPEPLRDFTAGTMAWPAWVCQDKMSAGAQALRATGVHGMMVLRDAGLMAGYQASAINQPLVMTGALNKGAQRRVAETTAWWLACIEEGGMATGGAGHVMTLRVRVVHAMVRYQLKHSGQWEADSLGLPINQLDMQATYLAFSVVQLLSLKTTGMWLSRKESDAVMHLWRAIAWLMGVDEGLLCDGEQQGRILLYQNLLSQAPPDESSVTLARALMDEPLQRHYPNWATVRGRFNKARHLSLVRWFVGAEGMRALGLPSTWPWYPLLMMGPWLLASVLLHAVPGLMPLWATWAGRRQRAYLKVLMGERAMHRAHRAAPASAK